MKERIITITLQIDEETHEGKLTPCVTENGEVKNDFTHTEIASTLTAIHTAYDMIAQQYIRKLGIYEGLWKEE